MSLYRILTVCFFLSIFNSQTFSQEVDSIAPEFVEIYFSDKSGDRITSITMDEKYYFLVVVSKNAIGEKATITLEEEDGEILYKGKYYAPSDTFSFKLKSDTHAEKIIIYNDQIPRHKRRKSKQLKDEIVVDQ